MSSEVGEGLETPAGPVPRPDDATLSTSEAAGTAAGTGAGGTLSLLASELLTLFRRRRTWAMIGALALIPILIGIALRLAGPAPSGRGPAFLSQITDNGLFVGMTALVVAIPLFLPLTIGVVAGAMRR